MVKNEADRDSRPASRPVPGPVRVAVVIILVESVALVGAAGILVAKSVTGTPGDLARALFAALMAIVGAAGLAVGGRALMRLRPAARSPIVVIQLLAVPVAYSLAFQADRLEYGAPILVAALAVIFLLFTPPARRALDRD